MAVKVPKNGVIMLVHGDTVAATGLTIQAVAIAETGGALSIGTLYSGSAATSGNELLVMPVNVPGVGAGFDSVTVNGCITTSGGLLYQDSTTGGTKCFVYVR